MKIKKLIIFILIIISALFLYTNFFNGNGYGVIKKDTKNINKMGLPLGVITIIGAQLWLKMVVT